MNRREFQATMAGALLVGRPVAALSAPGATSSTHLFVDNRHVLYSAGARHEINPMQRHPRNPVVRAHEFPWEVEIAWNSVYRDPESGRYQMWYQAYSGKLAPTKPLRCVVAYADSNDGVAWDKPNLGLHGWSSQRHSNIVLVGAGGFSTNYANSVVVDPRDSNLARRYKMAYWDFVQNEGAEYPGLCVAFSPDGIHWTKHSKAPLLRGSYAAGCGIGCEPVPYPGQPGMSTVIPLSISDAVDAIWDPVREVFVIYHKMWIDGPDGTLYWKHGMGRTESKDFVHWSRPELVLTPDDDDPPYVEFHHSPVFFHNGYYFCLLQILNRACNFGSIDIELAISHDGIHWHRPYRKNFILPRNPAGGFDGGNLTTNGSPVMLEAEMRFYYGGGSSGAISQDIYSVLSGIGLATLPRDRFACLRASDYVAQVTTRPFSVRPGTRVTLNAVVKQGAIRPELLDENGLRVRGFAREDAVPITSDSLRHEVRWQDAGWGKLKPGRYLLRLHLSRNAQLYAMTIHD